VQAAIDAGRAPGLPAPRVLPGFEARFLACRAALDAAAPLGAEAVDAAMGRASAARPRPADEDAKAPQPEAKRLRGSEDGGGGDAK
jgi:hypothetical protein